MNLLNTYPPFYWRLCVKKKLGEICFVWSPFMYHFFKLLYEQYYLIYIVGIFICIKRPNNYNYMLSHRFQSYTLSAGFMNNCYLYMIQKVPTIAYFIERCDIVIPPIGILYETRLYVCQTNTSYLHNQLFFTWLYFN